MADIFVMLTAPGGFGNFMCLARGKSVAGEGIEVQFDFEGTVLSNPGLLGASAFNTAVLAEAEAQLAAAGAQRPGLLEKRIIIGGAQ